MVHDTQIQNSIDTGIASLVLLSRIHGIPADGDQIKHKFGESTGSLTSRSLLRAAKDLGLKARKVRTQWSRLDKISLPAIAKHRDGRFFVLAKVSEENVLIQDPLEPNPLTIPKHLFEEAWSGDLILITRRDHDSAGMKRFDFTWFIPAIVKYRKILSEVLIASFFLQLFALLTPLFFQVVVDKVLVHRGLTTLDVLAIGLIAVSLFDVILGGMRTYLFSHTANRIDVELGTGLFKHLLALPLRYFESRRVGDSVARIRELENIRNFLTGSAVTVIVDSFFTIVFFAVMYYYSPILCAIVFATVPFYVLLSLYITPLLRARLHDKFNRGAENQAFLVESITGMETLKAMAVEPQMQHRWERQLAGYVGAAFKSQHLSNIAGQSAAFINKIMTVLILWFGARLVIGGDLSVGQLIAFNMLAGRVSGPILRMVQLWQDYQQAGISMQRLGDILNTPTEPQFNADRASLPQLEGKVSFERVSFRYESDGPQVIRDFSLEVKPGEVIGIVGRSGSGKSTLAKLVQRLYVPESGRVRVDGVDLSTVETAWLRRQVGVVLQENFLFNRSIRENIAISDPGVSMDKIVEVAKYAGAHDFILELPQAYDTPVGEQGTGLSGGQKQRIAIARALITDPKILIFDEATSALDYESERIIRNNMREISKGRTVFIIAHRLSAVRDCDRILVLDQGRIIEQGCHDELLELGGEYAELVSIQNDTPKTRTPSNPSTAGYSLSWQMPPRAAQ